MEIQYNDNKKEFRRTQKTNSSIQAKREVPGFTELLGRFERTVSVLGRSQSTFNNYLDTSRRCRHFWKIPAELDSEQIQDYLFTFRKSKSPSQSYFKHTVYGLRFLLKSEGLS